MSVLALGSATALSSAARADAERPVDCFGSYRVGSVVAHQTQGGQYDHPVHDVLAGARVFIYAQPGLTAEWLEYQLEQRAQARVVSQCPVDVEGVQVSVRSGGPGFWVTLRSDRELAATEILRRARLLLRPVRRCLEPWSAATSNRGQSLATQARARRPCDEPSEPDSAYQ
jgi:hypothetical protein